MNISKIYCDFSITLSSCCLLKDLSCFCFSLQGSLFFAPLVGSVQESYKEEAENWYRGVNNHIRNSLRIEFWLGYLFFIRFHVIIIWLRRVWPIHGAKAMTVGFDPTVAWKRRSTCKEVLAMIFLFRLLVLLGLVLSLVEITLEACPPVACKWMVIHDVSSSFYHLSVWIPRIIVFLFQLRIA